MATDAGFERSAVVKRDRHQPEDPGRRSVPISEPDRPAWKSDGHKHGSVQRRNQDGIRGKGV